MPKAKPRYFKRIFGLFLAAAISPAAVVSILYTILAGTALKAESENRLDTQLNAFSGAITAIIDSVSNDARSLAADQDIMTFFTGQNKSEPGEEARVLRRLLYYFPAENKKAEVSVIAINGNKDLLSGNLPFDRQNAYKSWGIFRNLQNADIAIEPRVATLSDGSLGLLSLAVPIIDKAEKPVAIVLTDIKRTAFSMAATNNKLLGGLWIETSSGKIIFDQAYPAREGYYSYELNRPDPDAKKLSATVSVANKQLYIYAEMPTELYDGFGRSARIIILLCLSGAVILAAFLAFISSSSVTKPVLKMLESMKQVQNGDLSIRLKPSSDDELGELALAFNKMTAEIESLIKIEKERQELLREAELRALAAQMNPHFLHNTLASIKSMAKLERNKEVADIVARLGRLLRAGADINTLDSSIGEGLARVKDYLLIEKARLGERFSFYIETDAGLEKARLPPLTLEPLAENALTHGIEKKQGKSSLKISVYPERLATENGFNSAIIIRFEDDGPGMNNKAMSELNKALEAATAPKGSHGMGLSGTNRRLFLEYGPGYGIKVKANKKAGFIAILRIPAIFKE